MLRFLTQSLKDINTETKGNILVLKVNGGTIFVQEVGRSIWAIAGGEKWFDDGGRRGSMQ